MRVGLVSVGAGKRTEPPEGCLFLSCNKLIQYVLLLDIYFPGVPVEARDKETASEK